MQVTSPLFQIKELHRYVDDINAMRMLRGDEVVLCEVMGYLNEIAQIAPVRAIISEALVVHLSGIAVDVRPTLRELKEVFLDISHDPDVVLYVIAEWFSKTPVNAVTAREIQKYLEKMPYHAISNHHLRDWSCMML